MALSKMMKRALAVGMAATLAVTSGGFSELATVTTVTAKAKKPSLSKKKLTMTKGKTKKLKVKKATKKVKWSTSNKKIVKVTKTSGKKKATATIKALKKGSAKITAKVGKKKLTCKVTVKAKAVVSNISSIDIDPLDSTCVVLTLKKAAPINLSDLNILTKSYNEGTYNSLKTVKTLTTTDQITYRIYISSSIATGTYLKVSLNGTDTKEIQYKKEFLGFSGEEYCEKEAVFKTNCADYFYNEIGTAKYSVVDGTLPAGLELNSKRGVIKGIPTTTGTFPVTIQATDELGRTAKSTVTFVIYDSTVVVAANITDGCRLDDFVDKKMADATVDHSKVYYDAVEIKPYGGSGSYKYTLATADNPNVRLSTDLKDSVSGAITQQASSSAELYIPYSITEGAHTYTITVTDNVNPALTTTVTVTYNATKYYNISGTAKDIGGAELSGNKLYFYPVGATSKASYVSGTEIVTHTDSTYESKTLSYTAKVGTSADASATIGVKKGTYATELAPGEYIVKVYSEADGIYYQMSDTLTVGAADAMLAVVAPVRFFSVSAIATYANGTVMPNTTIYFETKDEQYELYGLDSFYVTTMENGAFIASLPSNDYAAYILDETGKRQYITTPITVNGADLNLTEFKTGITRYLIKGNATDGSATTTSTNSTGANTTNASALANTYLYFDDGVHDIFKIKTTETGAFTVALAANTTYTVRAYINNSLHVLNKIVVAEANQDAVSLSYTFATELSIVAPVEILNLDTAYAFQSTGKNDMYAKFKSTTGGKYKINFHSVGGATLDKISYEIYNSDGYRVDTVYDTYVSYCEDTYTFEANKDYYIRLLPTMNSYSDSDNSNQAVGNFELTISQISANTPSPTPENTSTPEVTSTPNNTSTPTPTPNN